VAPLAWQPVLILAPRWAWPTLPLIGLISYLSFPKSGIHGNDSCSARVFSGTRDPETGSWLRWLRRSSNKLPELAAALRQLRASSGAKLRRNP